MQPVVMSRPNELLWKFDSELQTRPTTTQESAYATIMENGGSVINTEVTIDNKLPKRFQKFFSFDKEPMSESAGVLGSSNGSHPIMKESPDYKSRDSNDATGYDQPDAESSWPTIKRDVDTTISWLKNEILQMKNQDRRLMKDLLSTRAGIARIRDYQKGVVDVGGSLKVYNRGHHALTEEDSDASDSDFCSRSMTLNVANRRPRLVNDLKSFLNDSPQSAPPTNEAESGGRGVAESEFMSRFSQDFRNVYQSSPINRQKKLFSSNFEVERQAGMPGNRVESDQELQQH